MIYIKNYCYCSFRKLKKHGAKNIRIVNRWIMISYRVTLTVSILRLVNCYIGRLLSRIELPAWSSTLFIYFRLLWKNKKFWRGFDVQEFISVRGVELSHFTVTLTYLDHHNSWFTCCDISHCIHVLLFPSFSFWLRDATLKWQLVCCKIILF